MFRFNNTHLYLLVFDVYKYICVCDDYLVQLNIDVLVCVCVKFPPARLGFANLADANHSLNTMRPYVI